MELNKSRPRKPFVETVAEDMGDGFMIGGVFSSAYHLAKGGFPAVFKHVPRACCSSAYFFGVYAAIDYAVVTARRNKEEPVLDCAVAGGGASGITSLHKGLRYAGKSALVGAALFGVGLGGLSIFLQDRGWNLSPPPVLVKHKQADNPYRAAPAYLRPTLPVEVPWTAVADEEIRS